MKPEWYLYGRTQALRDVCREKTAINNLIRSKDSYTFSSRELEQYLNHKLSTAI
ncbi:hypothetical protein IMSAGC022_00678 [Alistipes sp.]|nr:hypothetical protein IMSAGC022_00678 [Alistipes sp.]